MTLNKDNIRQNFYKDLYDTLKAHATASSYSSSSQPTITRAYIDSDSQLPQIVLHSVLKDKTGFYVGETTTDSELRVRIDIFTGKNKKKDNDLLADDIDVLLGDSFSNFDCIGWSESQAMETGNQNKLSMKTLSIIYKYTN